MNRDTGFFKSKHDLDNYTGTNSPAVAVWSYPVALSASAYLNSSGVPYDQSGRWPILAARIPDLYTPIGRSGVSGLIESANNWAIVNFGRSNPHLVAFGDREWAALLPMLTPSATAR